MTVILAETVAGGTEGLAAQSQYGARRLDAAAVYWALYFCGYRFASLVAVSTSLCYGLSVESNVKGYSSKVLPRKASDKVYAMARTNLPFN